jgi:hypothetical protein
MAICWAWLRIPITGPYLAAGAGVAARLERVVQMSLRDTVSSSIYPALKTRAIFIGSLRDLSNR